jgi:hypothetical protein
VFECRARIIFIVRLTRTIYRGDCSSCAGDVSSLELYSFYSINTDPFPLLRDIVYCLSYFNI